MTLPSLLSTLGPFAIRTFDVGKGVAARDRKLAEGSPALFVLGTDGDTPADRLRAGLALARVLLRATQGVAASFLNQPVEVRELRPEVARLASRTDTPSWCCGWASGRPCSRHPAAGCATS